MAGSAGQQPIESLLLMAVGRKRQKNLGKPVPPGPLLERQHHRDMGPLNRRSRSARKRSIRPLNPGVVGWKAVRMASQATCSS